MVGGAEEAITMSFCYGTSPRLMPPSAGIAFTAQPALISRKRTIFATLRSWTCSFESWPPFGSSQNVFFP